MSHPGHVKIVRLEKKDNIHCTWVFSKQVRNITPLLHQNGRRHLIYLDFPLVCKLNPCRELGMTREYVDHDSGMHRTEIRGSFHRREQDGMPHAETWKETATHHTLPDSEEIRRVYRSHISPPGLSCQLMQHADYRSANHTMNRPSVLPVASVKTDNISRY